MFSKKFLVLILTLIALASFSFRAFAASGEGYFGTESNDTYQLEAQYYDEEEAEETKAEVKEAEAKERRQMQSKRK